MTGFIIFLALSLPPISHPASSNELGEGPPRGSADIWYLGHAGWLVRTADHLLVFDYAGSIDGNLARGELSPATLSAATTLLFVWVIGSLLALFVLGRSILDLRRLLKTRRFRPTGRLLDRLASAMGLRRPVRLSTSAAIAVGATKRPTPAWPKTFISALSSNSPTMRG